MRKVYVFLSFIFFHLLSSSFICYGNTADTVFLEYFHQGYPVYATITDATNVYKERRKTSGLAGSLETGATVEILRDYSAKWYLVENAESGITGWVQRETLMIPSDEPSEKSVLEPRQLEEYVNSLNLESETYYLIYTDLWRQQTHIFTGARGEWRLEHTFLSATGKNESPTTRGTFQISERGTWFFSKRLNSGGKYWVRFNDTYLFHSVAMDEHRQIIDGTLGERTSNGCIRLSVYDAQWIYQNITERTTVFIN